MYADTENIFIRLSLLVKTINTAYISQSLYVQNPFLSQVFWLCASADADFALVVVVIAFYK